MKHESLPLTQREWWISDADPLSTSRSCTSRGFSVVEILLAVSVFALLVTTLFGAYFYGQESSALSGNRTRATLLAEEGIAAVRNMRDAGFSNLADGTHGLSTSGNIWSFSGTNDATDIFTRQVVISSLDSHRKNITSTVTWRQNPERMGSVSVTTRLTEWLRTNASAWGNVVEAGALDLPGNFSGLKVAVSGTYAYVVRDGGSPNLFVVDISNPSSPSLLGTLDLNGKPSNIGVSGSYAYVSSSDNAQELQIINMANPNSPSLAGSFNAVGNADAEGVAISGSYAYIVRASTSSDELYIVNISNPSSPTSVGSLNLGDTGNEIIILGNNAYIASSGNHEELTVVNIATPALPSVVGSLDLPGNTDAMTVEGFGSTVLIGAGSTVYTVNVATPSLPSIVGSFDAGGTVNDIALSSDHMIAFLATSNNSAEFQVVNIESLSLPVLFGSVDISGNQNLYGVAYDSSVDAAYAVGDRNSEEFIVFQP